MRLRSQEVIKYVIATYVVIRQQKAIVSNERRMVTHVAAPCPPSFANYFVVRRLESPKHGTTRGSSSDRFSHDLNIIQPTRWLTLAS